VNLAGHFRLVWRRRWIILALSALVAGVVFARSRALDDVYESSATLDVISGVTSGNQPVTQDQVDILTGHDAALAETTPVLDDAIRTSGLDISVGAARDRVSADAPNTQTGFITVRASGPSPAAARGLTDGVAKSLRTTGQQGQNTIQIASGATTPSDPIAPTPIRDAVLAFLLALVVTSGLVALFGHVSGRLTTGYQNEEVARLTGIPVLALIPRKREQWTTDAFRTLRAAVDLARSDPPVRTIAVIGAEPRSGASFVAFGLAQATANLKMGVVLVDANLLRPVLAAELHIPEKPGLAEAIRQGTVDWDQLPQANPLQKRFRLLPAGGEVADPPGVLGSRSLRKTLGQLDDADVVVVDSPATDESLDALVIASQCDAAILVIDATRARRRRIENAVLRIHQANVDLIGAVVNRVEPDERTRPPRRVRRVSAVAT